MAPLDGMVSKGGHRRAVALVVSLLAPVRWRIAVALAAGAVGGVAEGAVLLGAVRLAMDLTGLADGVRAVGVGPLRWTPGTAMLAASVASAAALRFGAELVAARETATVAASVLSRLRREAMAQHLASSWAVQADESVAGLQDLVVTAAGNVADRVLAVVSAIATMSVLLGLLLAALALDAMVVVLVLVAGVVLLASARPLSRLGRSLAVGHTAASKDLADALGASSDMALEVRLHDAAEAVVKDVAGRIDAVSGQHRRLVLLRRLLPIVHQLLAIALAVVGLVALAALGRGRPATSGAAVLIAIRALMASQPLLNLAARLNELGGYWERFEERARRHGTGSPAAPARRLAHIEDLVLENISFAYAPGREVFEDLTLRVEAGTSVAVVGPSGSGKSTLFQMLLRLRDPRTGRYLVNGAAASEIAAAEWARRIGALPQEPRLWPTSVRDNIRFFREWVDDEAVRRAAELAQIHDEIEGLPNGYACSVGPRGAALSIGQRQRLCLARALAGAPDVLVLDEPSSALDERTEQLICAALEQLRGDVTLVVFTHRPRPAAICDRVLELRGGDLVVTRSGGRLTVPMDTGTAGRYGGRQASRGTGPER